MKFLKNTSTKDKILYLFSFVTLLIVLYLLVGGFLKKKSLENKIEYTNAAITEFTQIRYAKFFRYVFCINGKTYYGSGRYYPDSDSISVGDSILIIFDKTNPENNKAARDL